jgi:hypothetical protein
MPEGLLERIGRELGGAELIDRLIRLAPSDLQSLLLSVFARAAQRVSPAGLLEQYETNRFARPSEAEPRLLVEIDRLAWSLLPEGYVPLELSPVSPLGTSSAVATVHQNKVLSASRGTEVVADSTNVLARPRVRVAAAEAAGSNGAARGLASARARAGVLGPAIVGALPRDRALRGGS